MNIQAFSTFSICPLLLVYVPAFFQVFENISFSSCHVFLCRKAWAISSQADTLTTHSPKKDQFLAKLKRDHVKKQSTDSANRKTRRENVQGDLQLQPRVLVLQLQPNQKAFLEHLPRLHSWIWENLGVTGEPGGGQYQSRTVHGHEENLALGLWGPQRELWFWGDIFCFVLLDLFPPPTKKKGEWKDATYGYRVSVGVVQKDCHKFKANVFCTV